MSRQLTWLLYALAFAYRSVWSILLENNVEMELLLWLLMLARWSSAMVSLLPGSSKITRGIQTV